ncbi:MAG: ATP:cob(I)alamin adenosyltransferase, partial [Acidobacteriota bacterium]|nr:ATP:cob(I)alamin adenosyltransferase [Acidobacteriota bacterium]
MARLTKLYTRTGDGGLTRLGAGTEVAKDSLRVRAYGTVDELNSCIGMAIAVGLCERLSVELTAIQNQLFDLGGDLATP